MSPRKAVLFRHKASANVSIEGSKIPRRVITRKSATTTNVVTTSTRVTRSSTRIGSPSRRVSGANKENQPMGPPRITRFTRLGSSSPGSNRSKGIEKKSFGRARKARVPLRELTEAEIYERDECIIGDLRHRRVSGDSIGGAGRVVEVDSVLAHPLPDAESSAHTSSEHSAESDDETALTAPDDEILPRFQPKPEKFTVLRRSDSDDKLKSTLEAMIASNAAKSTAPKGLRTRSALTTKGSHPAVKNSFSPTGASPSISETGDVSAELSPIMLRSKRAARAASPFRSPTKEYAGITKVQASPSPIKMGRVGLGIKSANTAFVIKKVLGEANTNGKGKAALGAKPNTAVKLTSGNEKPVMKKKVITSTTGVNASKATVGKGKSSLKRAAGVVGSTNARVGLAGIGRMR